MQLGGGHVAVGRACIFAEGAILGGGGEAGRQGRGWAAGALLGGGGVVCVRQTVRKDYVLLPLLQQLWRGVGGVLRVNHVFLWPG